MDHIFVLLVRVRLPSGQEISIAGRGKISDVRESLIQSIPEDWVLIGDDGMWFEDDMVKM